MSEEHQKPPMFEYEHIQAGGLEGGRCFVRHNGLGYKPNNSCSHRWQAAHRAVRKDSAVYLEAFARAKRAQSKNKQPLFSTQYWPFPNNAHHLVPISSMRNAILSATGGNQEVGQLIKKDLIDSKYNINNWRNMMSLPVSPTWTSELGLPIHSGGHSNYDTLVREQLENIFTNAYSSNVKAAESKDEDHERDEDSDDVRKAIAKLQGKIHANLLAQRAALKQGGNQTIGEMREKVVPKVPKVLTR